MAVAARTYGTVSGVEALCPQQAGGGFSATTLPKLAQVERWLDMGALEIDTQLFGAGLEVPVEAETARSFLGLVNEYWAAARVEDIRTLPHGPRPPVSRETSKGAYWQYRFKEALSALILDRCRPLVALGALRRVDAYYVGGASKEEKRYLEQDPDFRRPAFRRGLHSDQATDSRF